MQKYEIGLGLGSNAEEGLFRITVDETIAVTEYAADGVEFEMTRQFYFKDGIRGYSIGYDYGEQGFPSQDILSFVIQRENDLIVFQQNERRFEIIPFDSRRDQVVEVRSFYERWKTFTEILTANGDIYDVRFQHVYHRATPDEIHAMPRLSRHGGFRNAESEGRLGKFEFTEFEWDYPPGCVFSIYDDVQRAQWDQEGSRRKGKRLRDDEYDRVSKKN
jgi:hypothetical protein